MEAAEAGSGAIGNGHGPADAVRITSFIQMYIT